MSGCWCQLPRLLPDGRMPIFSAPGYFWTFELRSEEGNVRVYEAVYFS